MPDSRWLWGLALSGGGVTLLFPVLAGIAALFFRGSRRVTSVSSPLRLEILIPAFNEEGTIERTLASVLAACRRLREFRRDAELKITIGLDGPTDTTRSIAAAFAERWQTAGIAVAILDRGRNLGKWATIRELVSQSGSDWSALVDSGSLWPEDFLVRIRATLETSACVGVAPGYRPASGGALSRLIWWQERTLKSCENLAGGPVSLHGATMIFRTPDLREALRELGAGPWLNDDVVIGLTLRRRGRIVYLGSALCVGDCGVREGASELTRRKRMLRGNVEWIRALFPRTVRDAPIVGLLALRRIMRVLWAYHLLFSIFCLAMLSGAGWPASLGIVAGLATLGATNRRLREAGWVSLATPILLWQSDPSVSWD